MIQADHFNLASVSKTSILSILKSTQVSKAGSLGNLFGPFRKDGANFYPNLLVIYTISQILVK